MTECNEVNETEGHSVDTSAADKVGTFVQLELPIAELTLREHEKATGHSPVKLELPQEGWICVNRDGKKQEVCTAAWPPPTQAESQR